MAMKRTNNSTSGGDVVTIVLGVAAIGFVAVSLAASAKRVSDSASRHQCDLALMEAAHQARMENIRLEGAKARAKIEEDSRKLEEIMSGRSAEVEKIVKRALHKEDISGAEDATIVG